MRDSKHPVTLETMPNKISNRKRIPNRIHIPRRLLPVWMALSVNVDSVREARV
ncbi:MAG: hypothetical protein ACNA8P_06035 [Phycisphaerales bacterium]